MGTARNWNRTW